MLAVPAVQTLQPAFGRHTYWIRIQLSLIVDLDSEHEVDLTVVSGPLWEYGNRPLITQPSRGRRLGNRQRPTYKTRTYFQSIFEEIGVSHGETEEAALDNIKDACKTCRESVEASQN